MLVLFVHFNLKILNYFSSQVVLLLYVWGFSEGKDVVTTSLLTHILHWYVSAYLSLFFFPQKAVLLQCSSFLLFTFYDFFNSVLNFKQLSFRSRPSLVLLLLFVGFVIMFTSFIFTKVRTRIYSPALYRWLSISTLSSPFPVPPGVQSIDHLGLKW